MFSDPATQNNARLAGMPANRRNRGMLRRSLLLASLAVLVASGCGRKGDPRPPSRPIPAAASDLTVLQRGQQIILEFGYPTTTTSGRALPGIDSVEVWEYSRPLGPLATVESVALGDPEDETARVSGEAGEAIEPSTSEAPAPVLFGGIAQVTGDQGSSETAPFGAAKETRPESELQVDSREFTGAAQEKLTLRHNELSSAISGARVFIRLSRGPLDSESPSARIFAVRTTNGEKLVSPFSNRAALVPQKTPAPPEDLKVVPGADGVDISWTQDEDDQDIAGYRVYRRDAASPHYGRVLRTLPATSSAFRDTTVQFGNRYIYTVTTLLEETQPVIESSIGEEFEINHVDRFAPDPPRNLVVFTNATSVRLLWEGSAVSDVAGYRVSRRKVDGEFKPLHESLIGDTEFIDSMVEASTTYFYHVVAVDLAGNASTPSEEIEARTP